MLTPEIIMAAAADSDTATLERSFNAFVLYPAGEGLAGFNGSDAMLNTFLDSVCPQLGNDFNPLPTDVFDVFLNLGFGPFPPTYRDSAAAATRTWQFFADRLVPPPPKAA